MEHCYLDYNATTPVRVEVKEAVNVALSEVGNPSSIHIFGRAAKATIQAARKSVADLVGADPDCVLFCGSGTEADNQVLRCSNADTVFVSEIEHDAVRLARADALRIPVDSGGVVDLAALEKALASSHGRVLVSIMAANNETGVIQPIDEISRLSRKYNALFHTDAIQAAGKIEIDFGSWGVDFLSLSSHKIGGTQGVGALILRDNKLVERFVHGGSQEGGLRAGTENVAGIAGFGAAARVASNSIRDFSALADLRDHLESRLLQIAPQAQIFGKSQRRLPNTTKIATPGLNAEIQVIGMDLAGYAISAGSACSAGKVEPPYVLLAMGVHEELARCAIRISIGWSTKKRDIDGFVENWARLYNRRKYSTP
jgi:cysteine desulfurase